jgi:hypothetical protein
MQIYDGLKLTDNLVLELLDPWGRLKDRRSVHNTVQTAGKYGAAAQMLGTPDLPKPGWMEVGTGTGGTTLLNAYVAASRTAIAVQTRSNAIVSFVCTFGPGVGNGNLTEIGLFDVVTQNTVNMWLYATYGVVTKPALDTLIATWTLTFA